MDRDQIIDWFSHRKERSEYDPGMFGFIYAVDKIIEVSKQYPHSLFGIPNRVFYCDRQFWIANDDEMKMLAKILSKYKKYTVIHQLHIRDDEYIYKYDWRV